MVLFVSYRWLAAVIICMLSEGGRNAISICLGGDGFPLQCFAGQLVQYNCVSRVGEPSDWLGEDFNVFAWPPLVFLSFRRIYG